MSQKRILITGAAGFLGSHLCDRFIKEGYYVIAMDNLITGDLMNIEHLRSNPNFLYSETAAILSSTTPNVIFLSFKF